VTRKIFPGRPDPLGATSDSDGTNFAVASGGDQVLLCLFDVDGSEAELALPDRDGDTWHGFVIRVSSILAANPLGRALYAPMFDRATGVPNLARFIFFDTHSEQVFPQWKKTADEAVALLQAEAARSPHSPAITQVVGELATRSEQFRTRWAAHNVTAHRHGTAQFRHPDFGELTLTYNVFAVAAVPSWSIQQRPETGASWADGEAPTTADE
jgi:hypothetical protein